MLIMFSLQQLTKKIKIWCRYNHCKFFLSNSESSKMDEKLQSIINQETHTTRDDLQAILESNRRVSANLDPIEAALNQVTENTK